MVHSPLVTGSDDSRESTVDYDSEPAKSAFSGHVSEEQLQGSAFLRLPIDIFKCVTDYLDREAALSLKRLCRGMANSKLVDEILYRYPIQFNEVRDIPLGDWKYRASGHQRWLCFQNSINDSNRHHVQKLAMSHWCSIADFKWIEDNLPSVASLELTAIKDFVWTPEETWTWKELADACPKLFARIEELEVPNWADYHAHSRIEYSYSINDYRFKQNFRLSRRRDGGSVAKMIFPLCTKLKTLSIRERYSPFHTWNEWEVHQRVCCMLDGIENNCPPTLTKLRVHDYAPYRSLFSTDVSNWPNIKEVEIGFYSWMEDRRDRDIINPVPHRITPGHHRRDEEEPFDDKSFDTCERSHMDLGQHVVQIIHASFEELLRNLRATTLKYPHIKFKPISNLRDIVLHPFHLANVTQRRYHPFLQVNSQQQQALDNARRDPMADQEIQEAMRWLAEKCDWKPIMAWDTMMCDVFPANLESNRVFLPKPEVISRIQTMVSTLRSLNIPIRLSIGDRASTCLSSGLDGSLYFGDYKCFVGEGKDKQELLAPTQARFNLTKIAHLVDELTVQYPVDVPGVSGWRVSKKPSEGEKELLRKEMRGWRRFFVRYALVFKNLKKLTVTVPTDVYNDWGKSEYLRKLLSDPRWEVLETDEMNLFDFSGFGGFPPFSQLRFSLSKKRPRMKFVQRVFFRQDHNELQLDPPEMSDEDREEQEIPDEAITTKELPPHPFWPAKTLKPDKRKVDGDNNEEPAKKKLRAVEDALLSSIPPPPPPPPPPIGY